MVRMEPMDRPPCDRVIRTWDRVGAAPPSRGIVEPMLRAVPRALGPFLGAVLGLYGGVVLGCSVGDLDVTGKACPCPAELTCDPASQRCVRATADGSSGSTSSSGGTTGAGGAGVCSGVCGTPGCGVCPSTPVVVVDAYDIDATEVTMASYQAFVDTRPDPANQPPTCGWNTSFAIREDDPDNDCGEPLDRAVLADRPVICVDWCDAHAYCAWAKRHLCGRIGGGPLTRPEAEDPAQSEWHRACTNAGTQAYPYGDVFDETRCNTSASNWGAIPIDVGQAVGCEGGYAGLFDMSGNIEEWEDSCSVGVDPIDPSDDGCTVRGGAYWTEAADSRCDGLEYAPKRSLASHDWGFRCCGPTG